MSRLIIGPLADYSSPVYTPGTFMEVHRRKLQNSRIVYLTGIALCLVVAFLWMETCTRSRDGLWVLRFVLETSI